jgi:hypothetical protein
MNINVSHNYTVQFCLPGSLTAPNPVFLFIFLCPYLRFHTIVNIYLEDGGWVFLRNPRTYLQGYAVTHPTRRWFGNLAIELNFFKLYYILRINVS